MNDTRLFSVFLIGFFFITTLFVPIMGRALEVGEGMIYVSPSGDDSSLGSFDKPFKTIERAKAEIRNLNTNMRKDLTVYLRGGEYFLDKTVAFAKEDSGSNGFNICYSAYPGEKPVLNCGISVSSWIKLPDSNLWKAKVDEEYVRQLYVNSKRKTKSATKMLTGYDFSRDSQGNKIGILINGDALPNINNTQGLELVWPAIDWKSYVVPVEAIWDNQDGTKTIKLPEIPFDEFVNSQPDYVRPMPYKPFYLANASEFLDGPSQWYFDSVKKELYYYPEEDEDMTKATAIIPNIERILDLSGKSPDEKVMNLKFEGIRFAYSSWNAPSVEGWSSLQSQWLMRPREMPFGMTPSAIHLNYCENISFSNNEFCNLGAVGLGMYNGVDNSRLEGNLFYDIVDSAIVVGIFSQANAKPSEICKNNIIKNNLITRTALEGTGSPAVSAYYVEGLEISHNDISDSPAAGISVGWGWAEQLGSTVCKDNTISNNNIHGVCKQNFDVGGIYTLGQQPNSVISGNYIHDLFWCNGAIYNDDGTQHYTVTDNVLENVPNWLYHWKPSIKHMTVKNNYSTTDKLKTELKSTESFIEPVKVVEDADWNAEALAIIGNAGLTEEFSYLYQSEAVKIPKNMPPIIEVLDSKTVVQNQYVSLQIEVSDDQLPYNHLTARWYSLEGPKGTMVDDNGTILSNGVRFENEKDANTRMVFSVPGTYKLALEVTDGALWTKRELNVQVVKQEIQTTENVALGKKVYASSYYNHQDDAKPENAVDGRIETDWGTGYRITPIDWLILDLGAHYRITLLELVQRQSLNQLATRRNFMLQASNKLDFSEYRILGWVGETALPHKSAAGFPVDDQEAYRYIRFTKSEEQYSAFAELRVFGEMIAPAQLDNSKLPSIQTEDNTGNIAMNKKTTASSDQQGFNGAKAVDGLSRVGWMPVPSACVENQWVQVDLGEKHRIDKVAFVTRQDLDQEVTRGNFMIIASNSESFREYEVIGEPQSSPLPYRDVWICESKLKKAYRFVRITKTVPEYFFIGELKIYGANRATANVR